MTELHGLLLAVTKASVKHAYHASTAHAHVSNASSTADVLIGLFVVAAFIVGLIFLAVSATRSDAVKRHEREAIANAAHAERLRAFFAAPLAPVATSITLLPGETCYYSVRAQQLSVHAQRQYGSTYGGPSVRIARGVYLRAGQSHGSSQSVSTLKSDGYGWFYLTDQRVIFIGELHSTITPLSQIIQESGFVDGLHLDIANRSPVNYETGDTMAHRTYVRITNGLIRALSPSEVDELVAAATAPKSA